MNKEHFYNRHLTTPRNFNDEEVSDEEIRELIEVARWAPTHKMTEPWRFVVLREEALGRLEEFMESYYLAQDKPLSPTKISQKLSKVQKTQAVIVILMHRDARESVPEWEEIAAVACAVENMWLYACNNGLAGYWSTPGFISSIGELVDLEANQRCLGIFYLGKTDLGPSDSRKRKDVEEISRWIYK